MGLYKAAARVTAAAMGLLWLPFPPIIRIETTNQCNAACSFCPHKTMLRPTGIMDQGLFEKLITECAAQGVKTLHLHNFGEPLLDEMLPERISLAKEMGIERVKIFTNGSMLTEDAARKLIESGLDEIKMSIDGADAAEFSRIRKGLSLDQIISNLRRFNHIREESSNPNTPSLTAACSQTSDKKATQKLLAGLVDNIDYGKLHNWGGVLGHFKKRTIRKPCARVWQTFTVLWNGEVSICCLDYDGSVIMGNVTDQTIADVWRNQRYETVRRQHSLSRQDEITVCRECTKSFF